MSLPGCRVQLSPLPKASDVRGVVVGTAGVDNARAGGLRLGRELYRERVRAGVFVLSRAGIVVVAEKVDERVGETEGEVV